MKTKIIISSLICAIVHASQEIASIRAPKSTSQNCLHLDNHIPVIGVQHIILEYLSFEEIQTLEEHEVPVILITFLRDSNYIVSASRDNVIKKWQANNSEFKLLETVHSCKNVYIYSESLSLSRDSRYLAAGSLENAVKV